MDVEEPENRNRRLPRQLPMSFQQTQSSSSDIAPGYLVVIETENAGFQCSIPSVPQHKLAARPYFGCR